MRVAVDTTPLLGRPTGIGHAVRGLLGALGDDVDVVPWQLTRSWMPVPPAVLVRLWARMDRPRGDAWLPEADVVHGTNFVVPPTRRPSTVTVHDCWCARHPEACTPTIRAATATVRRAIRRGAWVHVTTEWGAQEVQDVYDAPRVRVVPWGVPAVADVVPADRPPYVLALGAADDPRKGMETLVTAMAAVDGVELVRIGPDRWVDDTERAALLRGARAVAYPSRYEGFGLPVLEAMSVGVPVVATAVGAVPEVAGDAALLVPPDDPDRLAAALRTAVEDDAERSRLIVAGRARAASFTWGAHASGMIALWREAVG